MTEPLLAVKLFLPVPTQNLTERPHLVRLLENGLNRRLTLVSAPAGFGKSSLLSMWIRLQRAAARQPGADAFGWLSLDAADNHPARFWTYFLAALLPGTGLKAGGGNPGGLPLNHLMDLLQADPPPPIQPILDELINAITGCGKRLLIVLDDYHLIQSAEVHEQMTYLLDHQPPNLHLVISTRSDPPLPIARLRIRGQLNEVRAADLRFSPVEIEQFLTGATGIQFVAEDIAILERSTEGWIAGLQMAALALQAPVSEASLTGQAAGAQALAQRTYNRAHEFISTFSGKHIFILDYLADEVFNRQPEPVQAFLLQTSILDRFCVGLCDQVTGQSADEPGQPALGSAREILAYLEKANLFLVPLDDERRWFRYHHLFADLLRVRLDQAWPEQIPDLHLRASAWYKRSGRIEESITHALAAQAWERAAALMEGHIPLFLERGQLSKVMDWVALLPKEVASNRAWLTIQQTCAMGLAHRMKEFVPLISASERVTDRLEQSQSAPAEEIAKLRCNTIFQKGYYALSTNHPTEALRLAEEGLSIMPPDCLWEAFWLYWLRGYANRALSHLAQAEEGFQEALRLAQKDPNFWPDMICLTDQAMVSHLRGNLPKACDLYRQALELGRQRRAAGHSYLNRVEGWLSLALLERNEVAEAALHAETGLEWSQYWPSTNARSVTFIALSRIQLMKGDLDQAGKWLEKAEQERQKSPLMPVNNSLLDYNLVRYWIARGDTAAARWAKPFYERWKSGDYEVALPESLEMQWLALARVMIAFRLPESGLALEEAVDLLNLLLSSANSSGRVNSAVEAGILKAVVLHHLAQCRGSAEQAGPLAGQASGFRSEALTAMAESLAAGEAGGYMRMFLDEGPLAAGLLKALRARPRSGQPPAYSAAYLDTLLAGFEPQKEMPPTGLGPDLPEPLTEREREVLGLIAAGLSNKDMAERLVLSEGTIKSHVHHIMEKMGVQSRVQALVQAKELGLL